MSSKPSQTPAAPRDEETVPASCPASSPWAHGSSAVPLKLAQSDFPPAELVRPTGPPDSCAPTRWNLLLGRLLLRACPCGSNLDACPGCQVRPWCRCAHGHTGSATAVEAHFWWLLALLLGQVLYSLLTARLHRG